MSDVNLHVYATPSDTASACATRVVELLNDRLQRARFATLAVSGGSTPALMFRILVTCKVDWTRVHFFQVDERRVPPDDAQSNYRLAQAELFAPAGIPSENIHRIYGELTAEGAAMRYNAEVRDFFKAEPGVMPIFDVIHRGMGAEAHTASLFPGDPLIGDTTGIAAAVSVPVAPHERITMLTGPLTAARHTVMLVAGSDKAYALKETLGSRHEPFHFPAQIGTWHSPRAEWFVDFPAAAQLPK